MAVGIVPVGIVSVIWIGIVKEWVPKIAREEEVAIVKPTAAKATITKATAPKATAKPATVKAGFTEGAAAAVTAAAVRRDVRPCKSTNCKSNCYCNKFCVIHKN